MDDSGERLAATFDALGVAISVLYQSFYDYCLAVVALDIPDEPDEDVGGVTVPREPKPPTGGPGVAVAAPPVDSKLGPLANPTTASATRHIGFKEHDPTLPGPSTPIRWDVV